MKYKSLISFALLAMPCLASAQEPVDTVPADSIPTVDLGELVVEGSNVSRKGNVTTNVFSSEDISLSADAGALIGKASGVHYNKATHQITYLGSSNVKILLDGLPKDLEFIKMQNPDKFLKVEITDHPVGQYAGYDAVINLITKPKYQGYNGRLMGVAALSPNTPYKGNDVICGAEGKGSFAYTYDKWTFEAYADYDWGRTGSDYSVTKEYPLNDIIMDYRPSKSDITRTLNYSRTGNYFVTLGYMINPSHMISFQWKTGLSRESTYGNSSLRQTTISTGRSTDEYQHTTSGDKSLSNNVVLYYQGNVKNWILYSSVGYSFIRHRMPYLQTRTSGYRFENNNKMRVNYLWGVFSTSKRFLNNKLQLDLCEDFSVIGSSYRDYVNDTKLSSTDNFKNSTYATVGYYPNQKLGISLSVGAIIERLASDNYSKTHVSPRIDASVSWQPSPKFFTRIGYTTSMGYAYLADTQNYGYFTDSLSYHTGNINLKPAKNHSFRLMMNFLKGFSFSASYNYAYDYISTIIKEGYGMRPDGIEGPYAKYSPENGRGHSVNLFLGYDTKFAKHFFVYAQASVLYLNYKYENFGNSRWYPSCHAEFGYFGMKDTFMANLQYTLSPANIIDPQTKKYGYTDDLTLVLYKSWFNRSLSLTMAYVLPLHIASGNTTMVTSSEVLKSLNKANNQWRKDNRITVQIEYVFTKGNQTRQNDKSLRVYM